MEELKLKIALSLIPKIGPRLTRRLVAYAGGVEAVFSEKKKVLAKIPGIGEKKVTQINKDILLSEAEKEVEYIAKNNVTALFYLDKNYPVRLRECEDAPVIIYTKGKVDLNAAKILSIVGTRSASEYGKACVNEIISYLAGNYPKLVIVSGLAYGIDITAHKETLRNNLDTIAVLGHGLQFMYPSLHSQYAKKIIEHGALVTEFQSHRKPDPGNFISRNRIIAGLADATVVVESAQKGGALITADIACSYNRDVFAVPGKGTDQYSKGCNQLIKTNKAALAENGSDIEYALGWYQERKKPKAIQKTLFIELNQEEKGIIDVLSRRADIQLDELSLMLNMPVSKVSACLLNLEFSGLVRSLPGKRYTRI